MTIYVECVVCTRWKPSIEPDTEYCCGKKMRIALREE